MKKVILIGLMVFLAMGLFAQEINISSSLDVWSNVWMERSGGISFDENANFSSTVSLGYLQRFADEALKLGFGVSAWVPRSTDNSPGGSSSELMFSDFAAYLTFQIYPFRLSKTDTLADYLFIKGNLGYNYPLIFGDWGDYYVESAWGGFCYSAGLGMDTSFGLFAELLYSCSYWGAEIYSVGDLDSAGFQSFAMVFGYKFSFGNSNYN